MGGRGCDFFPGGKCFWVMRGSRQNWTVRNKMGEMGGLGYVFSGFVTYLGYV
jgi:hypothetical protein